MIGVHIEVKGIVQGVGFRPFIHREITRFGLNGTVCNSSRGAELELEGEEKSIEGFLTALRTRPPRLAVIEGVICREYSPLKGYEDFRIIASARYDERNTLISPDVCICGDCLRELFDPEDRRYRYPFINCTNCGPRFTIIKDVPYDRPYTTMGRFKLCPPCEKEYTDITDRRYHAQPVCCPDCGPELEYRAADGGRLSVPAGADPNETALLAAQELLSARGILAVKGLGGIHLACLAEDKALVDELRRRKRRDARPFALMMKDTETVRRCCELSPEEEALLSSHRRPIVLLKKKDGCGIAYVSENRYVGVMLPYTPVHYLLMEKEGLDCLVMTSANLSELPILKDNDEALRELRGIADGFLLNNRDIHVRCDDSLLFCLEGKEYFLRRSRGYVPFPVNVGDVIGVTNKAGAKTGAVPASAASCEPMPVVSAAQILACGAEQKASFSLLKGSYAFPSAHIGDLKNMETYSHYEDQIRHFERLFDIHPKVLACDLHPDYLSTAYAEERAARERLPLYQVQHHHAHMAACMADNGLTGEVLGIIWDGTGLGTDGTVWGGEFLQGGYGGFTRAGSLRPFRLPGGDKCAKELWRVRDSLLYEAGLLKSSPVLPLLEQDLNAPVCTSMGRLFDGVASLLGICQEANYEGQGAVLLEAAANTDCGRAYPAEIIFHEDRLVFDERPMIRGIVSDLAAGVSPEECAAAFLNTLVRFTVDLALKLRDAGGPGRIVLSGGTFQNMYLMGRLPKALESAGFTVYHHIRVSANDEGLSLGQLAVAAALNAQEIKE